MTDTGASAAASYPTSWKKPPFIKSSLLRWLLWIGVAAYLATAFGTMDVNWARVAEGIPRGQKFVLSFFPPDFVGRWESIVDGLLESIWMAIISTVAGIALSIPVGLGAAKNLSPTPVYFFCRAIIALSRTFPEVILAIFAVKLFGFGPFAGFLALSIATIGFYGKLLAEDIESMNPAPAEAVRSTGAGWFQWVNYAVQPQVAPRMIGLAMYRLDINFRESAVVGIVGGGGIGATLLTSFDRYEFQTAAAILITIIAIVMVLEYLSGYLRKWVQ
ncbi:MAG: phosphonate ABC transporter, permease protein PhnE [Pseudomonadota bacterium]